MANAVPMLGGTDASGGYLIADALGPVLVNGVARESAVMSLSNVQRINSDKEVFPIYAGRPTAAFVAEAAAKATTGAEFSTLSVDVKKIATIVMYTEELLADARIDPRVLVNADVNAAFEDLIDSHALGRNSSGSIVGQFNSELAETTSSVELGTGGDALAVAVSSAMETIEAAGNNPTGVILSRTGRASIRAARNTVETTQPVYTNGFEREPDTLYGLPLRYTTNLESFTKTPGADVTVGLVGDFSHAHFVVRNDIQVAATNQATVDVGGTLHHTWQQNKVAVRWEMRIGMVAHDLNNSFVKIINHA
jgi:HK97 family phage major capsid protein